MSSCTSELVFLEAVGPALDYIIILVHGDVGSEHMCVFVIHYSTTGVCLCGSNAGAGKPACGAEYNDLAKHARRAIKQEKCSYQRR